MKNYGKKIKKPLRKSLKKKSYKPVKIENEKSEEKDRDIVVIEEEEHKDSSKSNATKKRKTIGSLLASSNTNLRSLRPYKNVIFFILWFSITVRLFIADVGYIIAVDYFNISGERFIFYRFIIFALTLILLWRAIGNVRFFKNIALFIWYPIYQSSKWIGKTFLYLIPKALSKLSSVYFFYIYVETILSFIKRFKYWTVVFILTLLALYILVRGGNDFEYGMCIFVLLTLQYLHIETRWNELFGPLKLFQLPISTNLENIVTVEKLESQIDDDLEKELKQGKVVDEFIFKTERYIFTREAFTILNQQVKRVLDERVYLKSFIYKGFYSFIYAIVVFGGINYCLFKIDASNFMISSEQKGFFEFTYYSFFNIFSEGVDIDPNTRIAKLFRMIGVSVGIIVNFLILGVLFTVNSERYKEALTNLESWSNDFALKFSQRFMERFKIDIKTAEENMSKGESEIIKSMLKFRKSMKRDK